MRCVVVDLDPEEGERLGDGDVDLCMFTALLISTKRCLNDELKPISYQFVTLSVGNMLWNDTCAQHQSKY